MLNAHFFKMLLLWFAIIAFGIYLLFLVDDGEYIKNFFEKDVEHLQGLFDIDGALENAEPILEPSEGSGFKIKY